MVEGKLEAESELAMRVFFIYLADTVPHMTYGGVPPRTATDNM